MSSSDQRNEEYFGKLAILQTYVLDLVEAETFEEVAKHFFAAIEATIDPFLIVLGQVRFGALTGLFQQKGLGRGNVFPETGGMPLDGPGIMVRAINTGKICNVPDTRIDPSYIMADVDAHSHTLSEIAVPVIVQGKSIGVLNIEKVEVNAFNESDEKILKVLSGYVGVALNNILYSNRMNSLHKHTSQLNTLTNIDEVAEHTLDAMTDTLELELCTFMIPQEGVSINIYEKRLDESTQIRKKAYQVYSARAREADDIEFLSELETPVNVDDEVVAILSAKSIQPDKYTEQDKQLLEILANHVASTLQRIKLLEKQIQYEAKLEALHDHTSHLAEAGSIEEIAEYTVDAMSNTLGYKWGLFMLLEDDQLISLGMLGEYIARGYAAPAIPIDGPGITTRTARSGQTQLVNDTRLDPDYFSSTNTLSELDVPIKIEDKVIGVLNVESDDLNAFSEQDQELLEILASHVSSAIQRIRLLEAQIHTSHRNCAST